MDASYLRRAVALARPSIDSISEVAASLLNSTLASGGTALCDETQAYLEMLEDAVLNWIGEGNHDKLNELVAAFNGLLAASADGGVLVGALPTHAVLVARLSSLSSFISRLLKSDTMAKYLGLLTGKRYEDWRTLLVGLSKSTDPVRRSQAHVLCPGMKMEAGEKAVDRMTELGLVTKTDLGPKNVVVEITWNGRAVAYALQAPAVDDPEPDNEYVGSITHITSELSHHLFVQPFMSGSQQNLAALGLEHPE